ncbi:hypothetical protein KJ969_03835 [Patescibacteria group bacterium]|nr:hypothetical protein [Patescibacteria group bacterium]
MQGCKEKGPTRENRDKGPTLRIEQPAPPCLTSLANKMVGSTSSADDQARAKNQIVGRKYFLRPVARCMGGA